jgi:hypothetical protein
MHCQAFRLKQLMAMRAEALLEAVLKVQCAWRMRKSRELLKAAREVRARELAMKGVMATEVQRVWRGYAGKVAAWDRLEQVIEEGHAASTLQRSWRRHTWWVQIKRRFGSTRMRILLKRMKEAEAERGARMGAAILLQRYWHCWLGRQWLALRRRQVAWEKEVQRGRAVQIQQWFFDQRQRRTRAKRFRYQRMLLVDERRRNLQQQVDWAARLFVHYVVQVQRRMYGVLARNECARRFGRHTVVYLQSEYR